MCHILKIVPRLLLSLLFLFPQGAIAMDDQREEGQPCLLSMLKCVSAGDYLWIEISTPGEAEALRAGPGLHVFDQRRGRLSADEMRNLRQLLAAADLPGTRATIPFTPEEGLIVEDLYYFLSPGCGGSGGLVTHELVLPPKAAPLVQSIIDVFHRLPKAPVSAARIVAVASEMLVCLGEDAPRLDPGASGLGAAQSFLDLALRQVGRSVAIPSADLSIIEERLFRGSPLVRVPLGKKEYALLLFSAEQQR